MEIPPIHHTSVSLLVIQSFTMKQKQTAEAVCLQPVQTNRISKYYFQETITQNRLLLSSR